MFLIIKTLKFIINLKMQRLINRETQVVKMTMIQAIFQIMVIDVVFSFDSIITAVGLSNQIVIMVGAVIGAMMVMIAFALYVSDFINKYPTLKMLALAFLVVIELSLLLKLLHSLRQELCICGFRLFVVGRDFNIKMRSLSHRKRLTNLKWVPQPVLIHWN